MYARIDVAEDRDAIGDADLLRYFRRGDQSALDVLMERHRDALFRFCYHLTGNREDAEDVCQETLARAMTRVRTLQSDSAFRSWLFSIARNLSIDTHRRQKRTVAMPDDEAMPIQLYTETPQDSVEVAEEHQTVVEAMGKLAHSHQRVLVLREVEGMSYAAIAEQLDVSQSAVETLLFRARRRLKEEYHKSAAPALALIAGLRELILRAAGPAAGGTMAKLAMTAAVVGSAALTIPHSYHFPQIPAGALGPQHTGTAGTHRSSTPSHASATHVSRTVAPPSIFHPVSAAPAGSIASSVIFHAPRSYAAPALAGRVPVRHQSGHAAHRTTLSRTRNLKKSIPGLPSASNTKSKHGHAPPSLPSNGTVPISAAAPAAPALPTATAPPAHVKWVPAAVQNTSAAAPPPAVPTAHPTTAPPPTAAPVPTSAPVTRPAPGNSGEHGHQGKYVPVVSSPPTPAPQTYDPNGVSSGQTQSQSLLAQPTPVPNQSNNTSTVSASNGNVPPGQAKKDNPPGSDTKPGNGPHK